eukprot:jgi/Tetstr1/455518/TSEL_042343.t2
MAMELAGSAGRSLEENLRLKYSQGCCTPQTGLDSAIQQQVACIDGCCPSVDRPRKTAEEVEVKPCAKCQGVGEIREHYGFRVMTSPCENCDGSGCLTFKKGKLVTDKEKNRAVPKREKPAWAQRPRCAAHVAKTPCIGYVRSERIVKLQSEIGKIQAKKQGYEEEIAGVRASLSQSASAEERQLKEGLIAQLDKYLLALQAPLAKREASLARYQNPTLAEEEQIDDLPDLEVATN